MGFYVQTAKTIGAGASSWTQQHDCHTSQSRTMIPSQSHVAATAWLASNQFAVTDWMGTNDKDGALLFTMLCRIHHFCHSHPHDNDNDFGRRKLQTLVVVMARSDVPSRTRILSCGS
jgi:hypothetical protein